MNQIYFIADTHFGDDNIRRYENRPFQNIETMDSELVSRWNKVVNPGDIVYVLGDFGAVGYEKKILSQLNGHKLLVKGNHDIKSNEEYRSFGFEEVYDHPIIIDLTLSKQMKCHYDYICVEYPYGIEKGIFYINHTDILETLYHCTDYEDLHFKWMERKYGDYLAYYKHYRVDLRPDKSEMRKRHIRAKNLVDYYTPKLKNIVSIISLLIGIGIGITAFFTHQWLAVPGAVLFAIIGLIIRNCNN